MTQEEEFSFVTACAQEFAAFIQRVFIINKVLYYIYNYIILGFYGFNAVECTDVILTHVTVLNIIVIYSDTA